MPPILGGAPASRVSHASGSLSAQELHARVHRAAQLLAGAEGHRIAVETSDALTRLCWFLGADLVGAATLIVDPMWTNRQRTAVLDNARPHLIVTESPLNAQVEVRESVEPPWQPKRLTAGSALSSGSGLGVATMWERAD